MATMVNRSRVFFAALAAVALLLLTACGGEEEGVNQTQKLPQAFAGPGVSNAQVLDPSQGRKHSLAAQAQGESGSRITSTKSSAQPTKEVQTSVVTAAALPISNKIENVFNWAEQAYPQFFPTRETTQPPYCFGVAPCYGYRFYQQTAAYVGIQTAGDDVGGVYVFGAIFGATVQPLRVGHIDEKPFKCIADPEPCRPQVVTAQVSPANGVTGVDIFNVDLKVPFDRLLLCPRDPITGTFGVIKGTLTCANVGTTGVVTIKATELPENSTITATIGGFRSAEGEVLMNDFTWSFTTRKGVVVKTTRVLTVNWFSAPNGSTPGESVSVIDPLNNAVSTVKFAPVPGYLRPARVVVDSARGVGYMGALNTYVLHRFDVKTGQSLEPFLIDLTSAVGHGIQGIALTEQSVCIVTGVQDYQSQYSWRNRLICYNSTSGAVVFMSPTDFVATAGQIPTKLIYSSSRKKFYVLAAAEDGLFLEGDGGAKGRDGYHSGTTGTLTEIDAVTYQKGRSWNVGSMPLDGAIIGDKLYALKSGDHGATSVNLTTGALQSINWAANFGQYMYPINILTDEEKGVYYVSDWLNSVRVMSLSTDQEIGRISMPNGGVPRGMVIASEDLWVAIPLRDTFYTDAQSVVRIDRATRAVKQTITFSQPLFNGIGFIPWNITVYESTEIK